MVRGFMHHSHQQKVREITHPTIINQVLPLTAPGADHAAIHVGKV